MEGDDTAWTGIFAHIEKYLSAVEALGIVAGNEVPHYYLVTSRNSRIER